MAQSRISDARVIQYWDSGYLVAGQLRQHLSSALSCCRLNGTLWDLAALYGKKATLGTSPVFADGTLVDAEPFLRKKLGGLSGQTGD